MNEKKLKARDFITIGIFTAILWVVQMVIMYLGFLSPFIVAGYAVLIPIVTGIPMMLYYARIEKFGMLTITSVIVAILLFIFGMGFLGAPICIAAGVIADLIAKSGKYKSWKKTVISCGVFNLWVTTSPKGRMTAIMLLPLETSMPTQFIHIPPIQRICATGIHLFSLPIQSIG